MKKGLLFLLTLLSYTKAFALPVGNPIDASLLKQGVLWEGSSCRDSWLYYFSVRVGIYGDYVFNRYLEIANGDHERIANTTLYTNAGLLVLNFWDRVDLFATLGQSKIRIDTDLAPFTSVPGNIRQQFTMQGVSDFSWSIGGRGTCWQCGPFGIGIEGQYFSTHAFIRRLTVNNFTSVYPNTLTMDYHEWQLGLGVAYRISVFEPYIAVKWGHSSVSFSETSFFFNVVNLQNLRSRKLWGFAIGTTLIECDRISLTVEGRIGDEKALSFNGQLRI